MCEILPNGWEIDARPEPLLAFLGRTMALRVSFLVGGMSNN